MGTEVSRQARKHDARSHPSNTMSNTISLPTHGSFDSDDFDTTFTFDTNYETSKSSHSLRIRNLTKFVRLPLSKRSQKSISNSKDPTPYKKAPRGRDGDKRSKQKYERSRKQFSLMHELFDEILHGKFQAPVHAILEAGGKVLDVGCGNGCWAYAMASLYPRSKIHGLDLTDEFLNTNPSPTPYNFTFTLHNMHNGLPYANGAFDLVFSSTMAMFSTREQWTALVSEFQRVTKPGGFVELLEGDLGCFRSGTCPTYKKIYDQLSTAMQTRANIDPVLPTKLTSLLGSQPGLMFVTGNMARAPVGWDDGLGISCRMVLGSMLNTLIRTLLDDAREEDENALTEALNELAESKSYLDIYYAYAQKSMFC